MQAQEKQEIVESVLEALRAIGYVPMYATREDLREVKSEFKGEISDLRSDMKEMKVELKVDIAELRADMKAGFEKVSSNFKTIIVITITSMITIIGSLIGAVWYLAEKVI